MILRDVAKPDSKFFVKSEYGPLSEAWPALSYTLPQLKTWLLRNYRAGLDFIFYAATSGPETEDPRYRSRLLSVVQIDLTRSYRTEQLVPKESWQRVQEQYPGRWEFAFGVLRGWSFVDIPLASEIIPNSYTKVGKYPNRGMVLEIEENERQQLLDLSIMPVDFLQQGAMHDALTFDALRSDPDLNAEAVRLADLIFARVAASGTTQQRNAQVRTAPSNLVLQVAERLREKPLLCDLCGGMMYIHPKNRLLQPSSDRIDSSLPGYEPDNFQLTHLACNLAKRDGTVEQFEEWLNIVKTATNSDTPDQVIE